MALDPPCRYGLWVILGAGIVLGLVSMLFSRRQRKIKRGTGVRAMIGPGKVSNRLVVDSQSAEGDVEAGGRDEARQGAPPPA
jgi:hypothetical protein